MAWENSTDGQTSASITPGELNRLRRNRRAASGYAAEALEAIVEVMRGERTSPETRLNAAKAILAEAKPNVSELRIQLRMTRGRGRRGGYPEIPAEQLKAALRLVSAPRQMTGTGPAAAAVVEVKPEEPKP